MINRYDDVPHANIIRDNETIHIDSIFMFTGGAVELFSFLCVCKHRNCTVVFDNEDITVPPKHDTLSSAILTLYISLRENPKPAEDYLRYLTNYDKMKWEE